MKNLTEEDKSKTENEIEMDTMLKLLTHHINKYDNDNVAMNKKMSKLEENTKLVINNKKDIEETNTTQNYKL